MLNFISQMLGLSKPKNGLNGFHTEPSPLPKPDLLPALNDAQPILFSGVPEQADPAKPLPLIPQFILENILNVVKKYLGEHYPTADLAFADEIAALKQDPKYQGQPSLADEPEKSATFDFIQAAYPAIHSKAPRDQLAIDVVSTYSNKNRAQYKSLFKVCDIIAALNTLDQFASQMKKASNSSGDEAILATYQDSYYQQAIALHKRLLAHSDYKIKKQSGPLGEEIKKAFPEESLIDLPQPRMTRSRCPA